jgi:hypothetical protein
MHDRVLTAKYFPRPLASFALVPNSTPHPLTSNVILVNKDGDLELYAIHDTPKQLAWSARGDLALGAGLGFKVVGGYKEGENDDQEFGFLPDEVRNRRDTTSRGREAHVSQRDRASCTPSPPPPSISVIRSRGRQGASSRDSHASQPPSLTTIPSASDTATAAIPGAWRGDDEDGLSTSGPSTTPITATISKPTGLSVTRPKKPEAERIEDRISNRSGQTKRALSRTDTLPADDLDGSSSRYDGRSVSTARPVSEGVDTKSTSRPRDARVREFGKKLKDAGVLGLIKDDISMIMRRRVKAGYGLSQVRLSIHQVKILSCSFHFYSSNITSL